LAIANGFTLMKTKYRDAMDGYCFGSYRDGRLLLWLDGDQKNEGAKSNSEGD